MNLPEKLTIKWLREAYCAGMLTPEAVVETCLARAKAEEEKHVWIHLMSMEEIRPYIRGLASKPRETCPLWGIPFAIKDNIDLAGVQTTAGNPGYAYLPKETAEAVRRALDAGAIPIGKTNLDQFATGLVGTRSPYGEVHNALRPELISGGSSSGSAAAVALGQAAFAFGTDTAGSGRVPAALHGLYGWKASVGAIPVKGVVPACESLDCVSVFANTLEDVLAVDGCVRGLCRDDPWSRTLPRLAALAPEHIYIADLNEHDFYGPFAAQYHTAWKETVRQVQQLGIPVAMIDNKEFREAASMLYGGPLVAERWTAVGLFAETHPEEIFPVTLEVLRTGAKDQYSACALFEAQHRLKRLQMKLREQWKNAVYLTPTCGGTWTRDQVRENPIGTNTDMGRFTNHCNLLDLCAAALPAGQAEKDLPFGVTVFALCQEEHLLAGFAQMWENCRKDKMLLVVCGLHMQGFELEHQLLDLGAVFIKSVETAPVYKLYLLSDKEKRPGLVRVKEGGASIEAELWHISEDRLGSFINEIPAPLGLGKIQLSDGTEATGFLCEAFAAADAAEITKYLGYRNYRKSMIT